MLEQKLATKEDFDTLGVKEQKRRQQQVCSNNC
jgi:hypothetical protein